MNIGVIGYGRRIRSVVNEVLKQDERVKLTAIADIRHLEIKEQLTQEGNDSIRYYDQADTMLDQEALDGVLIGTRCSLHTEMALKVMQRRIPLYLEKPVATSMTDLYRLKEGYEASKAKVVVSFPLRVTTIVQRVKEIIDSGKIGEVAHVQAVNNVPYGLVYFQSWYRDEQETGGLFLQKATHDFDYINSIVGQRPTQVCAMTSKQVFKPTKPAGLKCVDCDENRTCNESVLIKTADSKGGEYCCYAADTGNEDSGSALLRYATELHASYSQNFFIRGAAKARGARFMGHKGTLEFDFYTGVIRVYLHHKPDMETYELAAGEGHFGGDAALARNFVELMGGQSESIASLDDGLLSALMCLKAKKSAETSTYQAIEW